MKRPNLAATTIAMALCVAALCSREAAFAQTTLEIAPDQTATVIGEFESLRAVLEELCRRGNAELRAYDADDRAVTANYRDLPLSSVLRALLNHENYLLGERPTSADGKSQVAWVHVSGNQTGAVTKRAARDIGQKMGFDAPPGAHPAASPPAGGGSEAQSMAEKMLSTPEQRAQLLTADTAELARSLQHYPDAAQVVRKLLAEERSPAVIRKLTEILAALE